MTYKIQVKEHLRNQSLYKSTEESTLSGEWKQKLLQQYALQQQLKNALNERHFSFKDYFYLGAFIICFAFGIATYLGFINPVHWVDNIDQITKFNIPPISLKEIIIFVLIINGLTFMIRKRSYFI